MKLSKIFSNSFGLIFVLIGLFILAYGIYMIARCNGGTCATEQQEGFTSGINEAMKPVKKETLRVMERMKDKAIGRYNKFCRDNNI